MKKLYTLILLSICTLVSINAKALTHYVSIGTNGTANGNYFSISTFTANIGDVVTWTLVDGVHDVTSTTIPSAAATFSSGSMITIGQQYSYTITAAGTYNYKSSLDAGMTASFTVGGMGITNPTESLNTSAFPVPCVDKVIFKYNGIDKIVLYNVIGEQLRAIELGGNQGSVEMNLDGMPSGIYFYNTIKEGLVFETKKIVKIK